MFAPMQFHWGASLRVFEHVGTKRLVLGDRYVAFKFSNDFILDMTSQWGSGFMLSLVLRWVNSAWGGIKFGCRGETCRYACTIRCAISGARDVMGAEPVAPWVRPPPLYELTTGPERIT